MSQAQQDICKKTYQTTYQTRYGHGLLVWRDGMLVSHRLPSSGRHEASGQPAASVAARPGRTSRHELRLAGLLEAYFAGDEVDFDAGGLPLDRSSWSPFDYDVAEAMSKVGWGSTISYSALAALAGHPRAQRAAGSFMARNPFPVIIACHRVIRSGGGLGNFSSGVSWKKRLLVLEGIVL